MRVVLKNIWRILLSIALLVSLWMTYRVAFEVYHFFHFSQDVKIDVDEWEIVRNNRDQYRILAKYHYHVGGKSYHKKYIFHHISFVNEESARFFLEKYQGKNWVAWYIPNHPEYSMLERELSLRMILESLIVWVIYIYFWRLRIYVERMKRIDS